MTQQIGMIGIGLMGHGIARNVLKHGFPLAVMDHPGNRPLDELRAAGVHVRASAAEVAADADVVILCVTGSPQVEAVLTGAGGVLETLRPGAIVVDCSTSIPSSTERMAGVVAEKGGRFVDAPMTRLAKHAHEGTLNLLGGGDPAVLAEGRGLLDAFSENVTHVGPVGAGHRMKLLHNYVSLGFMTLLAEAAAHAERAGVAPEVLIDVLAQGGGAGAALQRLTPFMRTRDASDVPFFISNAAKDLGYYRETAGEAGVRHEIADVVGRTLEGLVTAGHGQDYMPALVELLKAG